MKVIAWIIAIPLILLGLLILMRVLMCGPNSADVKVMKPMGDAINTYLVTQGKPPSLDSIPNLPYELKCEGAYKCAFSKGGGVYEVTWEGNIKASRYFLLRIFYPTSKTGISYWTEYRNGKYGIDKYHTEPHIYSSKRTGICNPMKQ